VGQAPFTVRRIAAAGFGFVTHALAWEGKLSDSQRPGACSGLLERRREGVTALISEIAARYKWLQNKHTGHYSASRRGGGRGCRGISPPHASSASASQQWLAELHCKQCRTESMVCCNIVVTAQLITCENSRANPGSACVCQWWDHVGRGDRRGVPWRCRAGAVVGRKRPTHDLGGAIPSCQLPMLMRPVTSSAVSIRRTMDRHQ
jgi:hypothetical protein